MKDGPLYDRYTVTHKDGQPVEDGSRYFVLNVDRDPAARPALVAYVAAIAATHPALASDLCRQYDLPTPRPTIDDLVRLRRAHRAAQAAGLAALEAGDPEQIVAASGACERAALTFTGALHDYVAAMGGNIQVALAAVDAMTRLAGGGDA